MFKNYLKTAWRNLRKNKGFSAINIIGLSIGMTACILIMVFVMYEKNFDGIHKKNIYRLNEVQKYEGMVEPQNVALSMFPMGPTMKTEFPEVINFTRVRQNQKADINIPGKKIILPYVCFVDSTFLQIFDFKLAEGDRATALQNRNSAVLTKATAKKIFGEENAMGKTIQRYSNDTISFTVTGIMEDIPSNSHMQFDALFSFNTIFRPDMMSNWGSNSLVTYLELAPGTDPAALEAKFPGYLRQHIAEREKYYVLFLQSLKDVHSGSTSITHDYINFQKFDKTYTQVFTVIALIILLIACINFMNLSTARSAERAREVGIRKSIGAERSQLAMQFIGESVLLCFIALLFAVGLAKLFLPYVENLSRRNLELSLFNDWTVPAIIIGGTLLVGIISGLYPALYLSGFRPIKVLKGSIQTGKNKSSLRNVLVVTQFAGAIFLIISTVFAVKQFRFMQKKDPGFSREQVMIMPLDRRSSRHFDVMKKELLNNSLVAGVTGSQQRLGNNLHQSGMIFHGEGPARSLVSSQVVVDPDYLHVYKIPLIAGRNFTHDSADNSTAYIINETLARELLRGDSNSTAKMESLLGRNFGYGGMDSSGRIVGIARDFNFNSLHHKIETLAMFNQTGWGFSEIAVRINGEKARDAVAFVESTWKKLIPDKPFEYSFLDDDFKELYRADSQVSIVVGVLATLAIIISCLGLFGLASYSAERKFKEIGIRKVLGASVHSIVLLLSGSFLRLILIANLIALPLAWWAMNKWLQDFAFRIGISGWIFLGAGLLALLIALITISTQAIRAAVANPVKSIRTE